MQMALRAYAWKAQVWRKAQRQGDDQKCGSWLVGCLLLISSLLLLLLLLSSSSDFIPSPLSSCAAAPAADA